MRTLALMIAAIVLAGCVQTRELQLAPNMVRLETEGRGLIGASQVDNEIIKKAAEATLARGYTHFRLDGAQMSSRSEIVGFTPGIAQSTFQAAGSYGWGTTTFNAPTPIRSQISNAGVTVIMFHAREAGARGAFDAQEILDQQTS